MRVEVFVKGKPYVKHKVRGDLGAPRKWSDDVQTQTKDVKKMGKPCRLSVEFILPLGSFPTDHPYGPDLDNLLKRLLDALTTTVLSEAPGKDGAIVRLTATKRQARPGEETGARLVFTSVTS